MSERCQESDVNTSSTYRDKTVSEISKSSTDRDEIKSDVSTSSTYRDETTSDVSKSSTYRDETTSDVSTSSTYRDETTSDLSMSSTYRDETTSDVSMSSTYRDETNGYTQTFIIQVIVCTVITLLVVNGVSVLVIKRGWLCFAKRNQDIETSAVRYVDVEEGRPTTGSNELSEVYDEIVDVLEDLTTTHPHGEEEGHYVDHYNVIDFDSVSPECPIVLIPDVNIESYVQCGLDNEDNLIPVSNDGSAIPICEAHPGSQSNMEDHVNHPSDIVFNVELKPQFLAHGFRTPNFRLKDESVLSEDGKKYCECNHGIISNTEASDCPTNVYSYVPPKNPESQEDNYLHAVSDEKDNYVHAVSDEKDNYLHAVSDEKDNYLHAVSDEKDNYLHAVRDEIDNYLHAVSDEQGAYLHTVNNEKDYFSHLDREKYNVIFDPTVNEHNEYASESASYLTLPPHFPDNLSRTQPLRNDRVTSKEFRDDSESNPYNSLKSNTNTNYEKSDETSSTATESDKDVTL